MISLFDLLADSVWCYVDRIRSLAIQTADSILTHSNWRTNNFPE